MASKPQYTFSRLFEGHRPGYPDAVLTELADRMKDKDQNRPRTPTSPPSGYIYFAQFVDHDLVFDRTSSMRREYTSVNLKRQKNERTPRLDLQTVYYNRQGTARHPRDGFLRIGRTEPDEASEWPGLPSTLDDLPRMQNGFADIFDERNDVTLLIAQLHVLFLKFHNRIVQYLKAGKIESAGPANGFSKALASAKDADPTLGSHHLRIWPLPASNSFSLRSLQAPRHTSPHDSPLYACCA